MSSREDILNRIKKGLENPGGINSSAQSIDEKIKAGLKSITPETKAGLWLQFEKELVSIAGEFYSVGSLTQISDIISNFLRISGFDKIALSSEKICSDISNEIKKNFDKLKEINSIVLSAEDRKTVLANTETALVTASYAIADTGTLVFEYNKTGTSYPHFLCDNTFVIITEDKILANQFELFESIDAESAKNMVFVTGPSRTADIEKVLVLGAHGPRKLTVIKIGKSG